MNEKVLYTAEGDVQFSRPYVDVDEWHDAPVRHRYVHGGFEGTESRFCFYYPEKEEYQGRFFQMLMPVQGPETSLQGQEGEEDQIHFSLLHGGYFVQTNMGGPVNGGGDDTLIYRCSANSAQFSRKLAEEMYGCGRPYGYLYGGSGGGFKTMSCAECTSGIWDGAVPFVIGSPVAMPNVFTVRAHAMRLLRNKMDALVNAIEPGGCDPYSVLNEEEREALLEVTAMGFPMKTWTVWETIGEGALPVLYPAIPAMDPTYFTDFWTKEGYLGTEPDSSAVRDRICYETEITAIHHPERGLDGMAESIDEGNAYGVDEAWKHAFGKTGKMPVLQLKEFPLPAEGMPYTRGLTLKFLNGELEGVTVNIAWVGYSLVTGVADTTGRDIAALLRQAKAGDLVRVDNSDYIAVQTYHRHQVPSPDFHAWDMFRKEDGSPKYPQRPFLVGPIIAKGGAGGVQEGRPNCKIIVVESHMDESAFPWQADWYRHKIMEQSGTDGNDIMRLWMMEHCMHTDSEEGNGGDHQHIVSYVGALHQALLDVAAWVERGVEPPSTTNYSMDGGQVIMTLPASERGGIQPTVKLKALAPDGRESKNGVLTVRAGDTVRFCAEVELNPDCGELREVTWDFTASDLFQPVGTIGETVWNGRCGTVAATAEHIFLRPGTWFPTVKVASNRNGEDFFTNIRNQDRVRIVVEDGK